MNKSLSIYIVTYNRKNKLKSTLDIILSKSSPVHGCSITVLDNNSDDGTSELLIRYSEKFKNLKYIKHKNNIGGNANICRAFELGVACQSDYFWVLCDDDKYSFEYWNEVQKLMEVNTAIICVSDYIFPDTDSRRDPSYQIFQLTFVPAGIYKTDAIDKDILISMYDSIYTMFSQSCIAISAINKNYEIKVTEHPVVFNGIHYEDREVDLSYTRGSEVRNLIARRRDQIWIVGFSNILTLLKDKKISKKCMEVAIPNKDIHATWEGFNQHIKNEFFNVSKLNYFIEIINALPEKRAIQLLEFCTEREIKSLDLVQLKKSNQIFCSAKRSTLLYILQCIFSLKDSNDGRFLIMKIFGLRLKFRKKNKKFDE